MENYISVPMYQPLQHLSADHSGGQPQFPCHWLKRNHEETKILRMCVYSNSRNDVPRVAQRYGTIAAHTRRRASVLVVCSVCVHMHSFAGLIRRTPPPTFSDTAITDRHSGTTISSSELTGSIDSPPMKTTVRCIRQNIKRKCQFNLNTYETYLNNESLSFVTCKFTSKITGNISNE